MGRRRLKDVTVVNSAISLNHGYNTSCPYSGRGGGIRAWDVSALDILNSVVSGNTSERYAPGLFLHNSPATITNTTIVNNTSPSTSYGAGIHLDSSTATVCNTIVTDNGSAPDVGGSLDGSSRNNLIGEAVDFADPANGDYRLLPGSAGVDGGDNSALSADDFDLDSDGEMGELIPMDLDGTARVQDGTVDIGAYELGNAEPDFSGNTPPTLDEIADRTLDEGDVLEVTAVGHDTDVPDQTLSYSFVESPARATIDEANGAISWQTDEGHGSATGVRLHRAS